MRITGPRNVTLVLQGGSDGFTNYTVVEDKIHTMIYDGVKAVRVIQTTKAEVVKHLDEHDVPYEREWGSVVLTDDGAHRLEKFLADDLNPKYQDRRIADITDHPSARVEGYTVDAENREIDVDYTYIPGL